MSYFLFYIFIGFLVMLFYFYCYVLFKQLKFTAPIGDRILKNLSQTGLFHSFNTSKCIAAAFLLLSLIHSFYISVCSSTIFSISRATASHVPQFYFFRFRTWVSSWSHFRTNQTLSCANWCFHLGWRSLVGVFGISMGLNLLVLRRWSIVPSFIFCFLLLRD